MTNNVIPLLINEDLVEDATDVIRGGDFCGNEFFKTVFQLSNEASNQLIHVLEVRKIIGQKNKDGNWKVLI